MEPYQTLQTHSHSSNTPIRLPERCSVAPSKKIFRPHAHLAGTIFIFQMTLGAKDIIIEHHYWHPHDVIAGLRAKNGAVDVVSCAWMWKRDFPLKCPDSVHSAFKFDWNRTWMFQLLEFCDTISYCDLIIYSEFRMIKSCTIKDMREIRLRFWRISSNFTAKRSLTKW